MSIQWMTETCGMCGSINYIPLYDDENYDSTFLEYECWACFAVSPLDSDWNGEYTNYDRQLLCGHAERFGDI